MSTVIVKTDDLNLHYGLFHALKSIKLDIGQNTITALIGPSGCGKSTFLRVLNRMNDLIENVKITGQIKIKGSDIYGPNVDVVKLRKSVGMVFQQPNPFPKTVYENVAFGVRIHENRRKAELDEIVETSLKQAALWEEVKDRLHKPAYGLSGGQQQRLCIARVLAVQPEIVLMDEPTSALDPQSTMKIEELLQVLKSKYTIIIVTHNLQQAARAADATAFFLNGEVIEYGDNKQIFTTPMDQRTEDYITGRFG